MKNQVVIATLGLALATGACTSPQSQSVVLVSVTADADMPATTQLRATLTGAGISTVEDFPQVKSSTPISFTQAASFALVIPRSHSGDLHVLIDALDADSQAVGQGEGTARIDVGGRADVTIVLHRVQPGTGGAGGAGGSTSPGTSNPLGSGGTVAVGSGGTVASGGRVDTGGTPASGGIVTSGGRSVIGGTPGFGGTVASGGRSDIGGTPGSGGTVTLGGRTEIGGAPDSGGTVASGGRTAIAGRTSTSTTSIGGRTGTAGASASGGATGGTSSTAPPSGDPVPSPGCSATPTTTSACTGTASAPCTIDVDGTTREYYLNLPTGYDGKKPVPVVWEYHPMGGNAKAGITMYQLNTKLTNVIFVSPQGLGSTAGFPNTSSQDEKMTRAINAEIEAKYCIDTSRYFATGFSYGGSMAFTAACNMSDIFRAVAAMSGSTVSGATCSTKTPARKVAVWATHGDADTTLPIAQATSMIQALAKGNGCSTTTAAVDPSPCVAYQGCQDGYPVVWCPRPGDTHAIPAFGAAAIAKFFQQYF